MKKYAKSSNAPHGGGDRHLHPWCADQQQLQYDITVDHVIAAGEIAEKDYIKWYSDGNEHNETEEKELLDELKQEGLSKRMQGFIKQGTKML